MKAGQPFIVELKGVGWTQLDNTVAVTYDNSYIGYACGFNSNGYVRIQLFATGEPGTHLIDLYPLLYTQQPAYPYPQLGMVPLLGFATRRSGPRGRLRDPGLPAGDQGRQVGQLPEAALEGKGAAAPLPQFRGSQRRRLDADEPGDAARAATSSSGPSTAISDGRRAARTIVASSRTREREADAELLEAGHAAGDEARRTRRP